jgi:hypothetical protein
MRASLRKLLLCAAVACSPLAGTLLIPGTVSAFPKPSSYPISWQLKFEHSIPKRIVVTTPGAKNPVAYWYMTFVVTNPTDEDQQFLPLFEMLTNDGTLIRSDKDVPSAVFDAVKKRERKGSLEPMEKITGRLRIGEDQAKDGVAIWVEPSKRMGTFHIFAGGLSGESAFVKDGEETVIKDWTKVSAEDRKKLTALHKTLDMTFQIAGDEIKPEEDAVLSKGEEWEMR